VQYWELKKLYKQQNHKMGKIIYFINAFFGILVGIVIVVISIYAEIKQGFNPGMAGLLIAGIFSVGFGIYEWRKYRATS